MLTVNEAFEKILATIAPFDLCAMPLDQSLGLALGVDIRSDSDSPPFDKSLMDGYAVRRSDVETGSATLRVTETITAGRIPTKSLERGDAIQIMTGAPLPAGTDLVIKVEETERSGDIVTIKSAPPAMDANVIRRGASIRAGAVVLQAGLTLNGSRIGALAELGCVTVPVRRRPRVAILATGDELVPVENRPGPGQIRNSNESMLAAQIENAGGVVNRLGIARDDQDELRAKIQSGLHCDMLVLSGGVSAGTLDLVPGTLAALGVEEIFHQVEIKPGKPIWFGVRAKDQNQLNPCYVFGLPGNPVSSLVCCELFVRTALRWMMGIDPAAPQPIHAKLQHDYSTRAGRSTYHPAKLTWMADGLIVSLVPWHGSSDLCGTVAANGMALLPGIAHQYRAGDRVETFAW